MPFFLKHYLQSHSWKFHFCVALALALLTRVIASHFAFGSQALDDFRHGLWPAYQFYRGEWINLPPYRSHLLVWVLGDWFKIGDFLFKITTPAAQAQWGALGLGLFSLWVFLPLYFWGSRQEKTFGRGTLYLIALQALMPFVTTRAFGESVATSLVLGGFLCCEWSRLQPSKRWTFIGFMSLGLSALFRFQTGLLYIAYLVYLFLQRDLKSLKRGLYCGILVLLFQCGIEFLSARPLFSTLLAYFDANKNVGEDYGVSPWHATWTTFLAFLFVPISLSFFKNLKGLFKDLSAFIYPCFFFLFLHSLVPHKEERFLYPVLGLAVVFLAYLWSYAPSHFWNRWGASPLILFLNTVILTVSIFSNTQSGEIEPIAQIEKLEGPFLILGKQALLSESFVKDYYVRPPNQFIDLGDQSFSALTRLLEKTSAKTLELLSSQEEIKPLLKDLEDKEVSGFRCEKLQKAQSLSDQILFSLHPEKNQRRRPSWFLICKK